jgi:hypothetical protein
MFLLFSSLPFSHSMPILLFLLTFISFGLYWVPTMSQALDLPHRHPSIGFKGMQLPCASGPSLDLLLHLVTSELLWSRVRALEGSIHLFEFQLCVLARRMNTEERRRTQEQ